MLTLDMLDFGFVHLSLDALDRPLFNDTVCDDQYYRDLGLVPSVLFDRLAWATRPVSRRLRSGRRRARLGRMDARQNADKQLPVLFRNAFKGLGAGEIGECQIVSRNGAALLVRYKRRARRSDGSGRRSTKPSASIRSSMRTSVIGSVSASSARRTWLIPSFWKDG